MAAQAKHGTRKFGVGRSWHRPYLLNGLVVCDHCGKRFRAHKKTEDAFRPTMCAGATWPRALASAMGSHALLGYRSHRWNPETHRKGAGPGDANHPAAGTAPRR